MALEEVDKVANDHLAYVMLTAPLTDGTNEPKNVCYVHDMELSTAIAYHVQLFVVSDTQNCIGFESTEFPQQWSNRIGYEFDIA